MAQAQLMIAVVLALGMLCPGYAHAALQIERYERQVSLKNQFVVDVSSITLKNIGEAAESTFQWCTLEEHVPHLAYLSVSFGGETAVPGWQTRLPKAVAGTPAGVACVDVPAVVGGGKLQAGKASKAVVSAVYTKLQVPFPKTVTQDDPQRVLYRSNLYALSPYPVATQGVKFDFGGELVSHTKHEKTEKRARTLFYGPFADVQLFSLAPLELHYVNNAPFAVAKTLERTLDVVWGKIHVDERYVVTHGGAKFTGEWSRYDYQQDPSTFAQSSFRELHADAPASARHLYFRDTIGNISTSAVRATPQGHVVALLPRVPLYGGWSTDFTYGFEVPLRGFSSRAPDGRRQLLYGFAPHVKGLVVDEQTIKVVLPEGAYDFSVEVDFEAELSYEPRYTYLNKQGRTVVVLRATNVVDALGQPFVIRYRVPTFAWLREPLLWAASLAAVLGAGAIFAVSDFSLVQKGAAAAARGRSQASAVAARAASIFAERKRALAALDAVFERPGAKAEDAVAAKKQTDAMLASSSEKLRDALRKLEALAGPGKATQLKALVEKETLAAEASARVLARRLEALRSGGSATDPKLEAQVREAAASRRDVATAVEALAASI